MTKEQLQARIAHLEAQVKVLVDQRITLFRLCDDALLITNTKSKRRSTIHDNVSMSIKLLIMEYDKFLKGNQQ